MGPTEEYRQVAAVLNDLGIEFFVGGSVASSFHGIPPTTRDVDIVAAIAPSQEAYLDRWSVFLKVEDLLALARSETP